MDVDTDEGRAGFGDDPPRFRLTLADRIDDLADRFDGWRDRPVVVAAGVAAGLVVAALWWLGRTPPPAAVDAAIPFASAAPSASATDGTDPSGTAGPGTVGSGTAGLEAGEPETGGSGSPASTGSGGGAPAAVEVEVVVVHVAGAVVAPGVYELPVSARVHDAIEAAGGAAPVADLDALNLAAPLVDGMQIRVPEPGETAAVMVLPDSAAGGGAAGGGAVGGGAAGGLVDLNRADADTLDTLPGVGPATAAAIVAHRDEHGPFAAVDDLEAVPGIGPAKLAAIADLVTVS